MDDQTLIRQRITQLRAELTELETAARVLNNLRSTSNGATRTKRGARGKGQEGSAKTITDYAKEILAAGDASGMHFRAVADEAIQQGYKGRAGSKVKAIQQSFWATMKRNDKTFKAVGQGKFTLV